MQLRYWLRAGLAGLALTLTAQSALAVRPFVTDDARIADYGQIEAETWFEIAPSDGSVEVVYNALVNVIPTDWLELGVAAGIGRDQRDDFTLANPGLQAKFLAFRPKADAYPGLALVAGVVLPYGTGEAYRKATGTYVIVPATLSLADDWILIHANFGMTAASDDTDSFFARPFWGLGTDIALGHPDWRLVLEAYAGDPVDALGPRAAGQFGFRWLVSDHLNLDMSAVVAPSVDDRGSRSGGTDWGAQIGLRVLFDVFTRGGRPGDPEGAVGWFPAGPWHRSVR